MHNFNLITDVSPDSCRRVAITNSIVFHTSDEWRDNHQDIYNAYVFFLHQHFPERAEIWHACERVNNARRQRVKRARSFVADLLEQPCVFLTLTLRDDVLGLDLKTLRQRANEFCRKFKCDYMLNVDFGRQNGRLHFHAVLKTERVDTAEWFYGFAKAESVKILDACDKRLAKYLCKLSCHSIKSTAGYRVTYHRHA